MSCNRLSLGALALTLAVSAAGLALAYGAIATAFERAATARHALRSTVSAGLAPEHRTLGGEASSS